jgi:formyltetrahydrofolate synthetase
MFDKIFSFIYRFFPIFVFVICSIIVFFSCDNKKEIEIIRGEIIEINKSKISTLSESKDSFGDESVKIKKEKIVIKLKDINNNNIYFLYLKDVPLKKPIEAVAMALEKGDIIEIKKSKPFFGSISDDGIGFVYTTYVKKVE